MAKIDPWYSTRPGDSVHHNNTSCPEGRKIQEDDLWPGTDERPLCPHCAALEQSGKGSIEHYRG
jgi:hypothetical protein